MHASFFIPYPPSISSHSSTIACTTSFSLAGIAAYSEGRIPQRTKHQKA